MLHTLRTGDARPLSDWAAGLSLPSASVAFFNFLASHDGIGLNPVRGLLPQADLDALVAQTLAHGGRISYKHNPDGSQSPYELNINYFDALSDPAAAGQPDGEPLALQVDRFLAAQAILLALAGLPGIYFHSLVGSRGWPEGVAQTGHNRTINRQKLQRAELERDLGDPTSLRYQVFTRYRRLLAARAASPAFHPQGAQEVLNLGPGVFGLLRRAPATGAPAALLQSVVPRPQAVRLDLEAAFGSASAGGWVHDLVGGRRFNLRRTAPLKLRAYQTLWLSAG